MRKFYAFLILFLVVGFSFAQTKDTYTTIQDGDYNDTDTWEDAAAPPATLPSGSTIVVSSGHILTINVPVVIEGTLTNSSNGTLNLANTLTIAATTGILNHSGNDCAGTAGNLSVYGTVNYARNGGTIHVNCNFLSGSHLNFTGITSTSPTIAPSDQFYDVTINCPSLTTDILLPRLLDIHDLTITHTKTGSVKSVRHNLTTEIDGNLTIGSNGKLILVPQTEWTVKGTLSNSSGVDGIILQSNNTTDPTGAIIADENVQGTIQRYVPADSWHMIGAGTTGSPTNNVFGAYFQFYHEDENTWEYVDETNYSLVQGRGYALYPIDDPMTITFAGTLYNNDIDIGSLSFEANDGDHGWHILSNPFSSAVTWNTVDWSLENVVTTAKVLIGGNWTDLLTPYIIAAQQGFAIQVTSATNSLTIPALARNHAGTDFFKSEMDFGDFLKFTLSDDLNKSADLMLVRFQSEATEYFDREFDSRELFADENYGDIYFSLNDEKLSTLAISPVDESRVLSVFLKSGIAENYNISLEELQTSENVEIILEDIITGQFIEMISGVAYSFSSTNLTDYHRFNLHLNKSNGLIDENVTPFKVWTSNKQIYISNNSSSPYDYKIYDISGRLIHEGNNNSDKFKMISLNQPAGTYIIQLYSEYGSISQKILM